MRRLSTWNIPIVSAFCRALYTWDHFGADGQGPPRLLMLAYQLQGIFEHSHHAEPEQIDLDDAHVRAILFIPLNNDATGHRRGFQWHDGIELPLAYDHASGMLPEMARQVLHLQAKLKKLADAVLLQVESGILELARECILRIDILPRTDKFRQAF